MGHMAWAEEAMVGDDPGLNGFIKWPGNKEFMFTEKGQEQLKDK